MRDRMERLVILPFTAGCISESSVAVSVQQQPKSSKPDTKSSSASGTQVEDEEESLSTASTKSSLRFLALPKANISSGFSWLFKSFKSFSQLFVYKEATEDETEMEIGFPTDVKHLTHIGADSSSTSNAVNDWGNLTTQLLSPPSHS